MLEHPAVRRHYERKSVLEEDAQGQPTKVRLIAHSKNRDDTYWAMRIHRVKHLYHFYTGEIPKEGTGYAVAFGSNCSL